MIGARELQRDGVDGNAIDVARRSGCVYRNLGIPTSILVSLPAVSPGKLNGGQSANQAAQSRDLRCGTRLMMPASKNSSKNWRPRLRASNAPAVNPKADAGVHHRYNHRLLPDYYLGIAYYNLKHSHRLWRRSFVMIRSHQQADKNTPPSDVGEGLERANEPRRRACSSRIPEK